MALTPGKAKKMLDDGTVHGRALTDKQKRYFGAIAGGATPMKKINGGWLDKYAMGGSLPGASGMMYGRSNTMPPLFTQSEMKAPSFADSLTKAQKGDLVVLDESNPEIALDEVVVTAPKYKYEYKKPEHLKYDPDWWNTEFKGTLDEYNETYGTDYKEGTALGDYIMDQYYRPQWNEMMLNRDEMQANTLNLIGLATTPVSIGPSLATKGPGAFKYLKSGFDKVWNYTPFTKPGISPTVGNVVNTGFLAEGIRQAPTSFSNMYNDPSWENAGILGLNALAVAVPGNTGLQYFRPGTTGIAPFIDDLGRTITANTKAGRDYQRTAQKNLQSADMWSKRYFNNPITTSRMSDEMLTGFNSAPPLSPSGVTSFNFAMNPVEVVNDYKKLRAGLPDDEVIDMVLKYQKLNPNMVVTPANLAEQLSVNVSRYNRMHPGFTHSTLSPLGQSDGVSNVLGRYSHIDNDRVVDIANPTFTGLKNYKDFGINLFGKSKLYDNANFDKIYQTAIHEADHFYRVGSKGNLSDTNIKLLMPFKEGLRNTYGKYMNESGEILLKSDAAKALQKSDPEAYKRLEFAKYAGTAPEIQARITQIRNLYNIKPGQQVDMSTVEEIIRAGKAGELGTGLGGGKKGFVEFFDFIDDVQGNVPGSIATTKEWLQGILMNMSKTGSKIKPLKYGGNVDKAQNGEVLGFDNLLDYVVKTRGGDRDMWGAVADTIAYHESGHTMNPKQKQIGGGPGRGMFQFEGPSLKTAKNRYKNVAGALNLELNPTILNAKSADLLSEQDQYTLFLSNLIESDATLADYATGKLDLIDLWLQGHKNVEAPGNRESFLHSRETAEEKGIPGGYKSFQKRNGGWLDKYEVIEDDMGQLTNPGKITKINSPNITMKGVDFPVLGISDTGDKKMMQPGKDYKFDGNSVTEYPMAQEGGGLNKEGVNQYQFLKNYMNSQKYQDRLKKEFPDYTDKEIAEEAKTRLNNVMKTSVSFLPESSDYSTSNQDIQGVYNRFGNKNIQFRPEYSALTPENPLWSYNTTPIHEFAHAADEGGDRIPQSTKDLMFRSTKDNSLGLPKQEYYYTNPTEVLGRMQEFRYLLNDQGIYDARKDTFTQEDLDKARKNFRIKNNARFQDLEDSVESDEALIEMMNSIAAVNQDNKQQTMTAKYPMAQFGFDFSADGVKKFTDNYKKIITGAAETVFGPAGDQINRGKRLLSSYSPGMVLNYKNYEDGDYLPVFNKAKDKDQAFAQARTDLGPGKRFIYDGVRYTTDYYGETGDKYTQDLLNRFKDEPYYDRLIEVWNEAGQPNIRGNADDVNLFGGFGPAVTDFTSNRPFFNPLNKTNTIYLGYDPSKKKHNQNIARTIIKELGHGINIQEQGTVPFLINLGVETLEQLPNTEYKGDLKKYFTDAQNKTYRTPGTEEYHTHEIQEKKILGPYIFKGVPRKKKQGGSLVKLNQLTNFTNYNTPQPGGWLDKY